jgi:organic radical activating enzyme
VYNLKLSETAEVIEGEGIRVGTLQCMIRTFGCHVRCKTCDSRYTWKNKKESFEKTPQEIFTEYVLPSKALWVSITGGDPLLQSSEVIQLIQLIHTIPKYVNIEVTGLEDNPELFNICDFISADIKTPNTGVQFDTQITKTLYRSYYYKIQFKAVVSDVNDILFLRTHYLSSNIPIIITPCWEPRKKLQLDIETIKTLLREAPTWRVILQQHKVCFGSSVRGV